MSDNLPDAVREYRRRRNRAMVNGEPIVSQARADAAIDALIEENKRLRQCGNCGHDIPLCDFDDTCSVCKDLSEWVPYWKEGE